MERLALQAVAGLAGEQWVVPYRRHSLLIALAEVVEDPPFDSVGQI